MRTVGMQEHGSGSVKCSGCSKSSSEQKDQLFEDADTLWEHISIVHASWIPFECLLCPKTFLPSETVLKQHYQLLHPGATPKAIYTYEEEKKAQVRRLYFESQQELKVHLSGFSDINIDSNLTPSFTSAEDTTLSTKKIFQPLKKIELHTNSLEKEDKTEEDNETHQPNSTTQTAATDVTPKKEDLNAVWCNLCRTIVRTDRTKKGNHIWHSHMPSKRFSCHQCPFEAMLPKKIKAHAEYKHNRKSGVWWTDRTEELMSAYEDRFKAAFGDTSWRNNVVKYFRPLSISRKHSSGSYCRLCEKTVDRITRGRHIWGRHMSQKRYICRYCSDYGTCRLNVLRNHARSVHRLQPTDTSSVCWQDNTEALSEEYRMTFAAAYGDQKEKKERLDEY